MALLTNTRLKKNILAKKNVSGCWQRFFLVVSLNSWNAEVIQLSPAKFVANHCEFFIRMHKCQVPTIGSKFFNLALAKLIRRWGTVNNRFEE